MSNLLHLSPKHLRQAAKIKARSEGLNKELAKIVGSFESTPDLRVVHEGKPKRKKHKMSAAGRARIAAAQKARWAKVKSAKKG